MDMVINNINDEALVYRNTSRDDEKAFLGNSPLPAGSFKGDKQNLNGLGALLILL
jgi:hypothetical protein